MIYSTNGHVFYIERWVNRPRSQAWTAVDGYHGLLRNDNTKRPIVATAATENAIREACRREAIRRNSKLTPPLPTIP